MSAPDPFPAGPVVSAYIARTGIEQGLAYLAAKLAGAPTWAGVCGPPGVGKTMLLRLLMRRCEPAYVPLYVPNADLTPDELERWIGANAHPRPGEDAAVLANRLAREGRPLLLAIDEAQLASAELVAWIERLCSPPCSARAVLAWNEFEGERIPAALARCPTRVFVEPLELAQVPAYVEAQLGRAGAAPEQRAALGGSTLERIALTSGGNPRIIQRLADAELAAHAWRTRRGQPLQQRMEAPRTTSNAPRSARGASAKPDPRVPHSLRVMLGIAGVALVLVATTFLLTR